jgi:hypothetical protein
VGVGHFGGRRRLVWFLSAACPERVGVEGAGVESLGERRRVHADSFGRVVGTLYYDRIYDSCGL